ncbi:MAG: NAD(P)/FAD-dependent oxidoreductase [Leptolyngbyaceae cyanobacterium bins.59]|nr:NAD(P)/FAD-dependent oxidoreductase [Leptolyngbyaceae cyanobacterium bins.59]
MAVDYNLAVIGGSLAGIQAAIDAVQRRARVALVLQNGIAQEERLSFLRIQALALASQTLRQAASAPLWGMHWGTEADSVPSVHWSDLMQWPLRVVDLLSHAEQPAALATLGIDVIADRGEFIRTPSLTFQAGHRRVQSRSYLLATGYHSYVPEIPGLDQVEYLTAETLGKLTDRPSHLIVLGGDPTGVALAQALNRLGTRVTVVVKGEQILAREDGEMAFLIQAQLEAEGVQILTHTPVSQIRQLQGEIWVQAGDRALAADAIFVAAGTQMALPSLNLEAVGVRRRERGLVVNHRLQTTNSRIYTCSQPIDGYGMLHIAQYQASIAVKNALTWPFSRIEYRHCPVVTFTDPGLARVGLTELQAHSHHGKDVLVLRHSFKALDKAQLGNIPTGFCKLLVHRNGKILGAHLVGPEASELIHPIALVMQQGLTVQTLASQPLVFPTLSEILQKTAREFDRLMLERDRRRQERWEGWLSWLRSVTK